MCANVTVLTQNKILKPQFLLGVFFVSTKNISDEGVMKKSAFKNTNVIVGQVYEIKDGKLEVYNDSK